MTKEQARIQELREKITFYNKTYHANDQRIGDNEYRDLYNELSEMEALYPEYQDPNSPTQTLDEEFEVVSGLVEVPHETPVLSLDKANTADDLRRFFERVEAICRTKEEKEDIEYVVENKFDGLTIVLKYETALQDALTRGRKGLKGERVLHTIRTIKSLPASIPFAGALRIRGEAILPKAEFERLNANGEYATARNLASGTIRRLDANEAAGKGLDLMVYDIMDGGQFKTQTEALAFLKEQGFHVADPVVFKNDSEGKEALIEYCFRYGKEVRQTLPYDIDGLVIKVNNLSFRERAGTTGKFPKNAIAFKFGAVEETTTLRDVEIAVNRTGQLSFTAIFDAIELDGCKTTRATLHNKEVIKAKDIRIGDRILVAKANDIIPIVVKAFADEREGKEVKEIPIPSVCPACGEPLVDEGTMLFCYNTTCPAQQLERLIHFGANGCMEIDGFGVSAVESFVAAGLLKNVANVYRLEARRDEIVGLEGFGQGKFVKLMAAIEVSKTKPLSSMLAALSIRHLGESTARKVASKFGCMTAMLESSKDEVKFKQELMTVDTVGEEVSQSVAAFFQNDENVRLIQELLELGLTMTEPVLEKKTVLEGLTFVVTGTLSRYTRKEIEAAIEKNGGKVSGSVSKKTSYLIAGEDAGSKLDKARALVVPIIEENDFALMIGEE